MEIRIGPSVVEGLSQGRFLPIGETGYVCLELPFYDFPLFALDVIYQTGLDGRRVLLIHPERCRAVRNDREIADKLRAMGVLGVASAGSLTGQFGPEAEGAVWTLMDMGLIQSVASDGHSVKRRPLRLSPARELVARRYGEDEASWMMDEVPARVLAGEAVELRGRKRQGWRRWLSSVRP